MGRIFLTDFKIFTFKTQTSLKNSTLSTYPFGNKFLSYNVSETFYKVLRYFVIIKLINQKSKDEILIMRQVTFSIKKLHLYTLKLEPVKILFT